MDETIAVTVAAESDLAQALAGALDRDGALLVESGGARYRLSAEQTAPPSAHEIARTVAAIQRAAGAWSTIDAETLKRTVRRRRRQGSSASAAR